MDIVTGS